MKRIIIISLTVVLAVVMFQGCDGICGCDSEPPVGVIQFDPEKSETIVGYDWNFVDTTGGLTTIPLGFMSPKDGAYQPQLRPNQIMWVEGMLLSLQKEFGVKVTSYQTICLYDENQIYLRLFFEPAINPEVKVLQASVDSLLSQNEVLQSSVEVMKTSLNQANKQLQKLNQIQKTLEEK